MAPRNKSVEMICDNLLFESQYKDLLIDEDEQEGEVMKYFDFKGNCVTVNSRTRKITYACRHGYEDTDQCPDCCH